MGAALGVSAAGPVAGGLFAAAQSALMGGGCAALAAPAWPLAAAALVAAAATSAAALVASEWQKAHLMGRVNGLVKGTSWAIVAHNWGKGVEIRSY